MMIYSRLCFIVVSLILVTQPAAAKKPIIHQVAEGDTPAGLARRYAVSYEEILRFNQMAPGAVLKVGARLKIPGRGQVTGATYTVQPGDSVARVADFHGVAQDDLRALNGLGRNENLKVGQELRIPHTLRGGAAGHVIREGDTLFAIAKKHNVPVKLLVVENKLKKGAPLEIGRTLVIPEDNSDVAVRYKPKKVDTLVKTGRKVAGGVKHTVQPGQSLWVIARAYNTSGEKIAAANSFQVGDGLIAGQELLIPGARRVVPVRVKGFTVQPVHFISVWNNKQATLRLLTNNGRIVQRSRRLLSRLAGPKKPSRRLQLFHPRLIHMLQRVAERYPGRSIELISGYREPKKGYPTSAHNKGRALDFRVQGVDRKELYEFVRSLPNVGAGYYPNSVFIHMDVRDKPAFWVDYSGVGEPALYKMEGLDPEAAADAE